MSSNVSKFLCVFCNFFVIYQKGSSILTFISKEHNGTGEGRGGVFDCFYTYVTCGDIFTTPVGSLGKARNRAKKRQVFDVTPFIFCIFFLTLYIKR
jgi:hypothetical protein